MTTGDRDGMSWLLGPARSWQKRNSQDGMHHERTTLIARLGETCRQQNEGKGRTAHCITITPFCIVI